MEEFKRSIDGLPTKERLDRIKSFKHEHIQQLRLSEMDHQQDTYDKNRYRLSNGHFPDSAVRDSTSLLGSRNAHSVGGVRNSGASSSMNMSERMNLIKERVRKNLNDYGDDKTYTRGSRRPKKNKRKPVAPRSSTSTSVNKERRKKKLIGKKNRDEDSALFDDKIRKITDSIIMSDSDCEMHSDPESETTPLPFDLPEKRGSPNGKDAKEYVKKKKEKHEKKKMNRSVKTFEVFINKKKSEQVQPASVKEFRLSAMNSPPSSPTRLYSPYSARKNKTIKQRNLDKYLQERQKKGERFFKGIKARPLPSFIKSSKTVNSKKGFSRKDRKQPKKTVVKSFKARVLPSTHKQNKSWSEIQEEQERERTARKSKRINYLRESSKLPPRMQLAKSSGRNNSNNELQVKSMNNKNRNQRNSRSAPRSTFRHKSIPNFDRLQQKFESKLQKARREMPKTKAKPFRFGEGGKNISEMRMNKVLVKMERDRSRRGSTRWPHHPFSDVVTTRVPSSRSSASMIIPQPRRAVKPVIVGGSIDGGEKSKAEKPKAEEEGEKEKGKFEVVEGEEGKEEREEEGSQEGTIDIPASSTENSSIIIQQEEGAKKKNRSNSSFGRKPPFCKSFSESSVLEDRLTRSIILQRGVVKKRLEEQENRKKEREQYLSLLKKKRRRVGRSLKVDEMTDRLYTKEVGRFRKRFKRKKKAHNSRYDRMSKFSQSPSKKRGDLFRGSYVIGKGNSGSSSKRKKKKKRKDEIGLEENNMFFDFYDGLHGQITQQSNDMIADFAGKYNIEKNTIEKIRLAK